MDAAEEEGGPGCCVYVDVMYERSTVTQDA